MKRKPRNATGFITVKRRGKKQVVPLTPRKRKSIRVSSKYVPPLKDEGFRTWLREKKNIDDRVLLTLGSKSAIASYRKEYNRLQRKSALPWSSWNYDGNWSVKGKLHTYAIKEFTTSDGLKGVQLLVDGVPYDQAMLHKETESEHSKAVEYLINVANIVEKENLLIFQNTDVSWIAKGKKHEYEITYFDDEGTDDDCGYGQQLLVDGKPYARYDYDREYADENYEPTVEKLIALANKLEKNSTKQDRKGGYWSFQEQKYIK